MPILYVTKYLKTSHTVRGGLVSCQDPVLTDALVGRGYATRLHRSPRPENVIGFSASKVPSSLVPRC